MYFMKKIFTLIAIALTALGVNAQTHFEANPEGLETVPANTVLTDNEFFKATSVYEAGGGANAYTYKNGASFTNQISLRIDADPNADNPYGTVKDGSTSVIIDAKQNITFTAHVRTGNNKEVCIFEVATSSKIASTNEFLEDGSNYLWSWTWTLEAGKQYVITERGGTGRLSGFTAAVATTGGDTGSGDTGSGDTGSGDNTGGGVTGETSKVILFYPDGAEGANAMDLQEGFKIAITGNADKNLSSGNNITVGGSAYKSIKISNGAQNTLTLPEGKVATKITLYSYVNHNEAKREDQKGGEKDQSGHGYRWSYWKEVAGTSYTQETAVLFSTFVDGIRQADNSVTLDETALQHPDAQTFELANLSAVTFTNTGEQPCIVIEVEYGNGSATGINNVTTSTIDVNAPVYNISGQQVSKNYKGIVIMNGKKYINK